jgi:FixJ family two-component response regulator
MAFVVERISKIYVVDDDPSFGKAIGRLLRSLNYKVNLSTSAEDFLKTDLKNVKCLLLDVFLPGMSGPELQKELKTQGYDIPIIFVSGRGSKELEEKVLNAGACGYLNKPFDEQLLIKMIAKIVN